MEEGKIDDRIINCMCLQGNNLVSYKTIGMIVYFHLLHVMTYYHIYTIGHYFSFIVNGEIQSYFCLPYQNKIQNKT